MNLYSYNIVDIINANSGHYVLHVCAYAHNQDVVLNCTKCPYFILVDSINMCCVFSHSFRYAQWYKRLGVS